VSDPERYVVISTVQGQFVEAQLKAFLEAHDIPCQLRGESLRVTHAISIDGIGAAEVLVPAALSGASSPSTTPTTLAAPATGASDTRTHSVTTRVCLPSPSSSRGWIMPEAS
jgi:hypothetical protein